MTLVAYPKKHGYTDIARAVLIGVIAGIVVAVAGALVLPLFGLSKAALPVVVGAITGVVAPWIGKSS